MNTKPFNIPNSGTPVHRMTYVFFSVERQCSAGFVLRCTVASVAFSPTDLTFRIPQLCMNGKQYPSPSGPDATYFIFRGCRAQSDPLYNYDLLKMIPNYRQDLRACARVQTENCFPDLLQDNFPWVKFLSLNITVRRSQKTAS